MQARFHNYFVYTGFFIVDKAARYFIIFAMEGEMISIVVPVYNVEEYLSRCVESLLTQNEWDIEIILVDDGSTDSSGIICDEYAAKYKQIKVIHQENGRPGAARNAGMVVAQGEFVGFVDADDWVEADMFSSMKNILETKDIDFVLIRTQHVDENGKAVPEPFVLEGLFDVNETNISDFNRCYGSPCNKLYRRKDLIGNGIRFPAGIYYEDNAFLWEYEVLFGRGYALNQIGYNYFIRSGSITKQKMTPRALDALTLAQVIKEGLVRHEKFEQYFVAYMDSLDKYFKLVCKRLPPEMRHEILPRAQQVVADVELKNWGMRLSPKQCRKWLRIKSGKLPRFLFWKVDIKRFLRSHF